MKVKTVIITRRGVCIVDTRLSSGAGSQYCRKSGAHRRMVIGIIVSGILAVFRVVTPGVVVAITVVAGPQNGAAGR